MASNQPPDIVKSICNNKDKEPDNESQSDQRLDKSKYEDKVSRSYSDCEQSEISMDPGVREDMERFQETIRGISERFRLISRIGEGTFSTVYKAQDLLYDKYENSWDKQERDDAKYDSPPSKKRRINSTTPDCTSGYLPRSKPRFVAIKKIYVTSSPSRILNELELLTDLSHCDSVCPLITAFRDTDQVVAVLPYFRHTDFRNYFRDMTVSDMQIYFRSLFKALATVHEKNIIHRDIKPTNFLYQPTKRKGVLVDFGLAERQGIDSKSCLCTEPQLERRRRITHSVTAAVGSTNGYLKNDPRPSRRANRAGTRGFRAPEVLLKCTNQTTKIDIWSAGVILLTILSRRFPFFNSADDVEAMIEIATIFGVKRMKQCALLHGTVFQTNIPTIGTQGFSLEKIILWSTCRNHSVDGKLENPLNQGERLAIDFLEKCLELDPSKRISAQEALEHEFLRSEEVIDSVNS
ncbi:BgTH12-02608 [Blumeria graminis f. sp. triticale]|uniref:non-specific serine/threonine protein kinase n=3 Tax=Blumeria graminis TaxID=34373 RepID=A0A381LFJ2_BLUGR|nr:Dbf4-dependent kinase catalytic subunit [Blumeria graminis f. sp. tritici 96224]CAD6502934.1 BgTH12-02608 [Blumeria graminis f. sp. triticale]VDB88793.1 Bgt-4434 [Blumeria graminis f. sp. tritici]